MRDDGGDVMTDVVWIELPVEFRGMWYNPEFGGFSVFLKDRFNPDNPPDRLLEALRKYGETEFPQKREHEYANPTWISRERFEQRYGRVEKVLVNKETWESDNYSTPDERDLLIFTEDYVVTLTEYDGYESFIALPRSYEKLLKR
jgi:hypothetical protein